jgi:dipeptidyl aminopeptidase/acylaminoacyl peptidase
MHRQSFRASAFNPNTLRSDSKSEQVDTSSVNKHLMWLHCVLLPLFLVSCTGASDATDFVPTSEAENQALPTDTQMPNPTLSSTSPPTPTAGQTLEPVLTPALNLPDCPTGRVAFGSYEDDSATPIETYIACASGTLTQEINPDYLPASLWWNISPSGDLVIWISEDGESLIVTDLSGQEITRLSDNSDGQVTSPTWSPDGEYIAYLREVVGEDYFRVDVVHVATGTVSEGFVPPDEYEDVAASKGWYWVDWSPTANQILLDSGFKPLHIADVVCDDTTHTCTAEVRAIGAKFAKHYPFNAWSPEGDRIAYYCYTTTTTGELIHKGICILDTEGHMVQEFPEPELGVENISYLVWSPDGTRIAFVAYPANSDLSKTDIFILSLSDMNLINLTSDLPMNHNDPIWIP